VSVNAPHASLPSCLPLHDALPISRWEFDMAERSLRGTNLSWLSFESDEGVTFSERQTVAYTCPDGHVTELPFSVEAEIPPIWECRCGLNGKLNDGPEP